MRKRPVAIYGTGRTAGCLVRELQYSPHVVVAAFDHVPARVGQDLGTLTNGDPIGVTVRDDFEAAISSGAFDLVAYVGMADERHIEVMDACIDAGFDIVDPCFFTHAHLALQEGLKEDLQQRLAGRAAATGARIVSAGAFPGLWFDVLPSLLSTGIAAPVSVQGRQLMDISGWGRGVLRDELGVGATRTGTPGGDRPLAACARMLAQALGLTDYGLESRSKYLLAEEAITVGDIGVRPGQIEGARMEVAVIADGEERVRLDWLVMANIVSRQLASIEAKPLELRLTGGDGSEMEVLITPPPDPYPATAARMVQAITTLGALAPGLHAPTALPVTLGDASG